MSLHQAFQFILARLWCFHATPALPRVQHEESSAFSKVPLCHDSVNCYTEASVLNDLESLEGAEMLALETQLLQARVGVGRHGITPSSFPKEATTRPEPETSKAPAGNKSGVVQSSEEGSTPMAQFFQIDSLTEKQPHTKKPIGVKQEQSKAEVFGMLSNAPILGVYKKLYLSTPFKATKETIVYIGSLIYYNSVVVVSVVVTQLFVTALLLSARCLKRRHDGSSKDSSNKILRRYERQAKDRINFDQLLVHRRFEQSPTTKSVSELACEVNACEVNEATIVSTSPKKLARVGTSFIVPLASGKVMQSSVGKRIWLPEGSGKLEMSFAIPVRPAVLPLKASLFRDTSTGPWGRIELTHDIVADAGMPPLLWCKPTEEGEGVCGGDGGETGGTVTCVGSDLVRSTGSSLEMHDGTRGVVAVLRPQELGQLLVVRRGLPPWQVDAQTLGNAIIVRRGGQEIATAMEIRNDESSAEGAMNLQVDTAADSDAPEAFQILLCILTMLAFNLMK